jgi:2-polyprenyl-3-methyl-5-hydroxy-6-metoxy-1,4-benzoquinol methylase
MQDLPTERTECPVCGPAPTEPGFRARDRLHGLGGEYTYERCTGCGLLYMNPRIRPDAVMHVYPQDYQPHARSAARSTGKRLMRRALSWIRGTYLPPRVRRALGPQSRVLDVGCGAGEFLAELRAEVGCQVTGQDLSPAAAEYARAQFDIEVTTEPFATAAFPAAPFDLVTFWWSLEHMPDPAAAVARMAELLVPGGHGVIAVPNYASLMARVFESRWYHLDCPRHYHLWTPDSLHRLLRNAGLEPVATTFDKSPWGLMGSLQNLVYGDNHHPETADRLRGNVYVAPVFLPMTFVLGLAGWSDTMVVTCERPRTARDHGR